MKVCQINKGYLTSEYFRGLSDKQEWFTQDVTKANLFNSDNEVDFGEVCENAEAYQIDLIEL